MNNSRQVAFETLYKIFYDNSYSNIALDHALSTLESGKAFTTRLVYGVLERKITLDYLISKYCEKPKPKVNTILRMGVYQLYFMDKVPASAAINESVELAKSNNLQFYSKLINAVLHKIDENRIDINEIDDLSIKYSVPKHLISMWIKQYSEEKVLSFLPYINGGGVNFAIPNTKFVDGEELIYELSCDNISAESYEDIVKITSAFDINKSKSYKNGLFHIEDLSCYEAIKALDLKDGETVIDVCSAPGGKSFTAAEMMNNRGEIFALDIYENRVNLVSDGAKRLELSIINASVNDATVKNESLPLADKIICDVPCSGFGTIRHKPEIRYKELDSIKELPDIQYKILKTSASYLKENGRIMYSTCTLNKKENEKIVDKFIAENDGFSLVENKTVFPSENGEDGFFYAILKKI